MIKTINKYIEPLIVLQVFINGNAIDFIFNIIHRITSYLLYIIYYFNKTFLKNTFCTLKIFEKY